MLSNDITILMNNQITKELESALLYLDFANYFDEKAMKGFGHWYNVQANEEVDHAKKFIDYLHDNGEAVRLRNIEFEKTDFEDDMEVLKRGLQHEEYVTMLIHSIYEQALNDNDYRSMEFLQWFIKEQAEEEKNAQELIDEYGGFCSECGCGVYMMNKQLAERK